MVAKAKRVANIILRSFSTRKPVILLKAFNTYVLPILLYNSCVWSPRLKKDQILLESVLKMFTFRIMQVHNFEYRLTLEVHMVAGPATSLFILIYLMHFVWQAQSAQ